MKHLIVLPRAVAKDPRITAEAFRTLGILTTYTDEEGWCWPSIRTIALEMGVGKSVIHERIASLVAAGYVEKVTRKRPNGLMMSLYRVLLDTQYRALSKLPAKSKLSTNVATGSCPVQPDSSATPESTVRSSRTEGSLTTERKSDRKSGTAEQPPTCGELPAGENSEGRAIFRALLVSRGR